MKKIRCLILAAGLGTRMNTNIPKPLHKIANKTMIEYLIGTLKSTGIKHITVIAGYGFKAVSDILKKYNIKTIRQKRLLGSADAVKAAKAHFCAKGGNENILVLYTDTPLLKKQTLKGLIDTHITGGAVCTLVTATFKDPSGYGRIVKNPSGEVIKIIEEKDAADEERKIKQVNVGAYCFKKKDLFNTLDMIKKNPKKGEFYLTDIIKLLKDKGLTVRSFDRCSEEEALGINSRQDLSIAEKVARAQKVHQLMEQGVTFLDPHTAYIDENVEIAKDTIIYPSVVIEGEVTIGENCRIGPFARIRGKTVIAKNCAIGNFVEIVRSKIGASTRVKHHAYLGDARVGSNVNIGAGAITANYDGKNKHTTIIKDSAFIGVGAVLIAPVKIGRAAVVGAGCVVTKNKNVPDKTIVAGVPARVLKESKK